MSARRRNVAIAIVLVTGLLTGCASGAKTAVRPPTTAQQSEEMTPEAKAYLDEVLDLMQSNSINRLEINWDAFRARAHALANGAKSIEDLQPAITVAVRMLGDRHSSYVPKAAAGGRTADESIAPPRVQVPSTVGYIRVSAFTGTGDEAAAYVDRMEQAIKSADSQGATGWVVDLRGNTGGNMWPMLNGLAPLLEEGTLGYFVDPAGAKSTWELRDGAVCLDGQAVEPHKATYRVRNNAPRVAVLTDGMTASSGEAVAISFKGRPETRFFGTTTFGVSMANQDFPLSDGATLVLTVAVMADRTGRAYGGQIYPNELVANPDEVVRRAVEWVTTGH